MQTDLLKCDGFYIVMQEIPDEITLAINVTECPYHCVGCHSPHLWESYGDYVKDVLPQVLSQYRKMITCVCFMGGDQHMSDLLTLCKNVKLFDTHLKTALYTGADDLNQISDVLPHMDYVKTGRYIADFGGLDNPNTNQRMYKKDPITRCWSDITYRFWRKNENQTH